MTEPSWTQSWLQFFQGQPSTLDSWIHYPILGQPVWQYGLYILWIALGFWLVLRLISFSEKFFKKLFENQHEHLSVRLIERLALPMKVVFAVSFIVGGLKLFRLSPEMMYIQNQVLILAWGISFTFAVFRITEVLFWQWKLHYKQQHNQTLNAQLFLVMEKGTKLFFVLTLSMMTLHNLGVNITSLLASLSIGSIAVALAAQDTIANLFGAVSILADNTFQIGDYISVDKNEGTVESIGLRSTRIRNKDGHVVTIPNKNMGTAIITNVTQRKIRKKTFKINLTYQTSASEMDKACQILEQIFRADPATTDVSIYFQNLDDSWLTIEVNHSYKAVSEKDYIRAIHSFNKNIKESFDREKFNFAYPTSTVFIEKNS